MILRRRRFSDLVRRQLELFEQETDLLDEAAQADEAWSRAAAGDSEELYGDYQLIADAIGDALLDIRETYAATLEHTTAREYRGAFDKAARKRYGRLATVLDV